VFVAQIGLNIEVEAFYEKYLGLPTAVGRITNETSKYITDSDKGHMNGWAERSYPAKKVLLKAVIQAKSIQYELLRAL
jgi:hypothetical protein